MVITFLVGNGFEMASGLKTSYQDFYKWYCNQPSEDDDISKFKKEISLDVKKGGKCWADLEKGLGRHTKKYTLETAPVFLRCYNDIQDAMIQYIEQERSRFDLQELRDETADSFSNGLVQFRDDLNPMERKTIAHIFDATKNEDRVFRFISFNYTDILDLCLSKISNKVLESWKDGSRIRTLSCNPNVIHVHGTLDEFPILGVNDESQVENRELLSTLQLDVTLIKPKGVNAVGQTWHTDAEELIGTSHIICVYGMSLGETDARWWEILCGWLSQSDSHHLIIYWYAPSVKNRRSVNRTHTEIERVKDLFFDYSDMTKEAIGNVRDRVHVILNTKTVLQFPLVENKPKLVSKEIKTSPSLIMENGLIDEEVLRQQMETAEEFKSQYQQFVRNSVPYLPRDY